MLRPDSRNTNNGNRGGSLNTSRDSNQPPPQSYTRVDRQEPGGPDIDEEPLEIPDDNSNYSEGKYRVNEFNDSVTGPSQQQQQRSRGGNKGSRALPASSLRLLYIGLGVLVVIIVVLAIVLPLTLTRKKEEAKITTQCPDGINQPRIDCLFDRASLQQANFEQVCKSRGCCWSGAPPSGGPNCAFPSNFGFRNYKVKENTNTRYWFELARLNSAESLAKSDISNLEVRVEMHTDHRLRIKIFPRRNFKNKIQRWEVPSGVKGENFFQPLYEVRFQQFPFAVQVVRKATGQVIFDTTRSSLVFSDQLLQLTTTLSSPNVFGIGENGKENFLHDMNFKSWPMSASQNHPAATREKLNTYSQFPMYLNIEPDGNSHVVVFYNSNPSEFYLTPFPSATFRSIGGIFDIYIFMGPSPIQAIEQFQQAFGLPKLPPYWALGLQTGAKKYGDSNRLKDFISNLKETKIPFDSIQLGTEHLRGNSMFTVNPSFYDLNDIVDSLRNENRAMVLELLSAIVNTTQNLPFSEGVSRERYWIMENFFSTGVIGKLLNSTVLYPDFTMEKTKEWWRDALQRFILTDQVIRFDGIYMDHLLPVDETTNKTCPNNKWNNPTYKLGSLLEDIYNGTICMDSRYEIAKHYNIKGLYSHFVIETTAKAFDALLHNRTFIMSRHAFLGTNQFSGKYTGDYDAEWEDFRKSVVSTIEASMFGFSMAGGDVCGTNGIGDSDLCENWLRAGAMSPMMRLFFDTPGKDDEKFMSILQNKELFEVLNSTLYLRYSLLPHFYTQLYKATKYGTMPIRPLAFQFPNDTRSYRVNNQWMWGDSLLVTVSNTPGGLGQVYLPKGEWYDYYKGYQRLSNGEQFGVQVRRNETSLFVRGGTIVFKQDCSMTAVGSKNTFIDVIIALDESNNYTATGILYMDDHTRKSTERKENYHRLINFTIYRNENDGIIEVRRLSGRYLTKLSYRDLIIYGLRTKPSMITVNENSVPLESSKTLWDEANLVYHVNLQTEVKKKVLLDNEYLSFRWNGGFADSPRMFNPNMNFKR